MCTCNRKRFGFYIGQSQTLVQYVIPLSILVLALCLSCNQEEITMYNNIFKINMYIVKIKYSVFVTCHYG